MYRGNAESDSPSPLNNEIISHDSGEFDFDIMEYEATTVTEIAKKKKKVMVIYINFTTKMESENKKNYI
jgi:hypothetical protein